MTDTRATERLLEVIAENAENLLHRQDFEGMATEEARKIIEAALELRRRGDTLVRADDLRNVLAYVEARGNPMPYISCELGGYEAACTQFGEIIERLKSAAGSPR